MPMGILHLSFWGYVIATLLLTHVTILGVTIFLHRCQAHRSVELHPVVSHFFRFWLWATTGMRTKEWVAVHRKHHAKCETPEDPHSPQIFGIKKLLLQGAFIYRKAAKNTELVQTYGNGTPDDWMERNLYWPHDRLGISLMLMADLILFGLPGILIWMVQMIWIPAFAAGVINGLGHYWGYRNFESADTSTNINPLAIFIGGEELHNNHHAYPASAKLSVRWWEVDIGWFYIRLLQIFGLAKVKRTAPKIYQIPNKTNIDADTLSSVLAGRMQIFTRYCREVIQPIFVEEERKLDNTERNLLQGIKKLLLSSENLLDDKCKPYIESVLKKHYLLQFVYQYRNKLQSIWEQTTGCQQELINALEKWCAEAETVGIGVLRDFSKNLRSYSLHKVLV